MYKWYVTKSIIIVLVIAFLFYATESPWVFLLLLLIGSYKQID